MIDKINQQPISDKEIIVVNDGSDQKTKDILEKCLNNKKIQKLINHELNMGKGEALRSGLKNISGDIDGK